MALLGDRKQEYEIIMMDDFENIIVEYVLADDVEHAAWEAYRLSNRRNLMLKDVMLYE